MAAVAAPPSDRGYSGFVSGQAPCHDHDGGPVHHGLVVSGPAFVVADQPAVPQQPAEGALDDPSAADDLEAGLVAALDDLQGEAGGLFHPDGQRLAVIAAAAHMIFRVVRAFSRLMARSLAPARSLTWAPVTTTDSSQPSASTAARRPLD